MEGATQVEAQAWGGEDEKDSRSRRHRHGEEKMTKRAKAGEAQAWKMRKTAEAGEAKGLQDKNILRKAENPKSRCYSA